MPDNERVKDNTITNQKGYKMTQLEFAALCDSLYIHPAIALENDNIVAALEARDAEAVERILKEEF